MRRVVHGHARGDVGVEVLVGHGADPGEERPAVRDARLGQLGSAQVEDGLDDPVLVHGSDMRGERRARIGRVMAAKDLDAELPSARDDALEQRRPVPAAPLCGIDEQLDEAARRPVHVEHRAAAVGDPVAVRLRRRQEAVERDHFVASAHRLARVQLLVACNLELVEAREHVVGRGAGIDLADLHRARLAGARSD